MTRLLEPLQRLSRPLRWALGTTLALTLAAWIWPGEPGTVRAAQGLLAPRVLASGAAGRLDGPGAEAGAAAAKADVYRPATPAPWPLPAPEVLQAWAVQPPTPVNPAPSPRRADPPLPATAAERPGQQATPVQPAEPPAFPYRWIGSMEDESGPRVFLASTDRTLSVRSGERIDAQWQLQGIQGRQLQLLWLPGGQVVQLGAS